MVLQQTVIWSHVRYPTAVSGHVGANFSADDKDIFILLLHYCHQGRVSCNVLIVSPIQGRAVLNISVTVEKHQVILQDLLAAHALTGCDTVASYFGLGKGGGLKIMWDGKYKLDIMGTIDGDVPFTDVSE